MTTTIWDDYPTASRVEEYIADFVASIQGAIADGDLPPYDVEMDNDDIDSLISDICHDDVDYRTGTTWFGILIYALEYGRNCPAALEALQEAQAVFASPRRDEQREKYHADLSRVWLMERVRVGLMEASNEDQ